MNRILALIVAVGLVVGAVFIRRALDDDDSSAGSDSNGSGSGVPTLVCATEVADACLPPSCRSTMSASAPARCRIRAYLFAVAASSPKSSPATPVGVTTPGVTTPGILDALNDLGFSYRWVTRWIAQEKTQATKHLTRLRRQWFAKRKSVGAILREVMFNRESALVDPDAENKALDAE